MSVRYTWDSVERGAREEVETTVEQYRKQLDHMTAQAPIAVFTQEYHGFGRPKFAVHMQLICVGKVFLGHGLASTPESAAEEACAELDMRMQQHSDRMQQLETAMT